MVYPDPAFVIVTVVEILPAIIVEYPTWVNVPTPTVLVATLTFAIPICGSLILTTACVPEGIS